MKTQSRRDDLESLAYIIIELIDKKLLKHHLLANDDITDPIGVNIMNQKMSLANHLSRKQFHKEIITFLKYVQSLQFEEQPNYGYLHSLLSDLAARYDISLTDGIYDWSIQAKLLEDKYISV